MRATNVGGMAEKPMWKVENGGSYYLIYNGQYTVHRLLKGGRPGQASIMHSRYDDLRRRIDAAIASASGA